MKSFRDMDSLVRYVEREGEALSDLERYRIVLRDNAVLVDLLRLLERVNPCHQEYHLHGEAILVSYIHHLNLLTFTKRFRLRAKVRIIGLPISLSLGGVLMKGGEGGADREEMRRTVRSFLKGRKGLSLVLNSGDDLSRGERTLSAFVFHNRFPDFQAYLDALRAPYRRRVNRALEKGRDLEFTKVPSRDFTEAHHALYLSIMDRTDNPLETLPIAFFREYDAEIFEVRDGKSALRGFVQLKSVGSTLYFMFCGFQKDPEGNGSPAREPEGHREDADTDHIDLYYNMLLFIIRHGIGKGHTRIEMGQTSEETKLKIGCVEEKRYLCLHHGNPLVDAVLNKLTGRFAYRGYGTRHRVFREGAGAASGHAREKETG